MRSTKEWKKSIYMSFPPKYVFYDMANYTGAFVRHTHTAHTHDTCHVQCRHARRISHIHIVAENFCAAFEPVSEIGDGR